MTKHKRDLTTHTRPIVHQTAFDGSPSKTIIYLRQGVLYGHNLLQPSLYIFWQLKWGQRISIKTDAKYALIVKLRINHINFRHIYW